MKVFFKTRIYLLLFLLISFELVTSCNQASSAKTSLPDSTNAINKTMNQQDTFFVKDSNKYSQRYLEKLKTSGYAIRYQLIDSMLIMNDIDTTFFPTYLQLNKKIKLTGKINNRSLSLFVHRKSYTTIVFELQIFNSGQLVDEQKGEADIGTLFFLGAESDEDDKTGLAYFAFEYSKIDRPCELSIRIGADDGDQLKAKLIRQCSDKRKDIYLEDCPTLRKVN